jgi:hypothetical protein
LDKSGEIVYSPTSFNPAKLNLTDVKPLRGNSLRYCPMPMIGVISVAPDSVSEVPFPDESIPQFFVVPEFGRNVRRSVQRIKRCTLARPTDIAPIIAGQDRIAARATALAGSGPHGLISLRHVGRVRPRNLTMRDRLIVSSHAAIVALRA